MENYTTVQIESVALLVIFIFYFSYKINVFIQRIKSKSLLSKNRTLKKLKRLAWDDFERVCMELFEKEGWKVLGNTKKGADGGVDIWMEKRSFGQKKFSAIVQCKRYEDASVTVKTVREMYGLMYEYDVDAAYVVTTSRFTKECYRFIEGKNMVLIDAEALVKLINKRV